MLIDNAKVNCVVTLIRSLKLSNAKSPIIGLQFYSATKIDIHYDLLPKTLTC